MKHAPIPAPSAIEQLAHDILDGMVTNNIIHNRDAWVMAARDAVGGESVDLEAYLAETELWENGHWQDPDARAAEGYVPISCQFPGNSVLGAHR